MPDIIIPKKLNDRLSLDSTWQPVVTTLKEKVQKIIRESPFFFPDYTDHGIDHVNEVLILANRLIPEDTYAAKETDTEFLLDPQSVGFLVCAILIHDLGMFLKTDGMEQLVYGDSGSHLVEGLDEEDWRTSWSKYVVKTRRLKDNEMDHLFGHRVTVSEDCARKGFSTNGDDCRVIGEFLRQNHGRLAHEIAVHGFPGDRGSMLIAGDGITDEDRDMIGLLARSHQMNIRDTEEYIERFGEGSKPHSIPAFYLMTVLRMADYLDASEKRAPEILERIQKIRVPASSKEWSWNKCISKGPKQWELQKHNLVIRANPTKSTEYVLLDNWLRSVQAELDLCWSIIADQYSGEAYRLTIHRVLSNIHQKKPRESFNEKFLTKEAKITANPAIVKLMMEPLYGNEPTYGVRELLQNAVDACLERKKWEKDHGNPDYKGLVDIRIENDTFTITDNGMGMNEDVLLNYYLSAGSSYRSSDAWMAANAPDGKSQVARTGKFGVGFLASFLLGDEVEVHTQHREDKKGYQFKFDQESRPLDIQRADRINPYAAEVNDPTHAGTTITIKLKEIAKKNWSNKPEWHNWYAFDEPKVRYFLEGTQSYNSGIHLHQEPSQNNRWLELSAKDFSVYQWHPNPYRKTPTFYCNGIFISGQRSSDLKLYGLDVPAPQISVIDKHANLDVDLSRHHLKSFPEQDALRQAVFRYHLSRLLLIPWNTEADYLNNISSGFHLDAFDHIPFLFSKNGFLLNHTSSFTAMHINNYVILCPDISFSKASAKNINAFLTKNTPYSIHFPKHSSCSSDVLQKDTLNFISSCFFTDSQSYLRTPEKSYWGTDECSYFWMHNKLASSLRSEKGYSKLRHLSVEELGIVSTGSLWIRNVYQRDITPIQFDRIPNNTFLSIIHVTPNTYDFFRRYCSPNTLFTILLKEILDPAPDYPDQDLWIPFDMEERKKKFPKAFEELKYYMDHIQKYPFI